MEKLILAIYSEDELRNLLSSCLREVLASTPIVSAEAKSDLRFLRRQEAANLLKISLPTLHLRTISGEIPSFRIGSSVRYRLDDIETFSRK